jgi:uncharacterized SAM-binding protein YcdF (DUF218 family)
MAFKKLLGACLLPFPIALALLLAGLALLRFSKRERAGKRLIAASAVMFLITGYDLYSSPLLGSLERTHRSLTAAAVQAMAPLPTAVVVLGSGYRPDESLPPNDRVSTSGLARLVEGIRLLRMLPEARLIVSDGFGQGQALADTAAFLGVPRERIALEPRSRDTAEEAALLRPLVGDSPFLLVTSASHMRRAIGLFKKQGLHPIAAPTNFAGGSSAFTAADLVPGTGGFVRTDQALHEWIGLAWSRMRGQI